MAKLLVVQNTIEDFFAFALNLRPWDFQIVFDGDPRWRSMWGRYSSGSRAFDFMAFYLSLEQADKDRFINHYLSK